MDVPHHRQRGGHATSSAAGASRPSPFDDDLEPADDRDGPAARRDGASRPRRSNASRTRSTSCPPKLRSVVVLKDVYDLSHEAIADELGITVAAAKVRLHRGRRKLRDVLYDEGAEAHAV